MVRMIPPTPRTGANSSERKVFGALEGMVERDDWVVIHSLEIARHRTSFTGEADFIVLAPGRGIAVIETKSPSSARYEDGEWTLENTPNPTKDPLQQLDGVRRSLRGYLKELDLLQGTEPIARLVWFTSLGRHDFEQSSDGGMQLFEWELAWSDDLGKPAWLLDHLFDEFDAWYSQVESVEHDPATLTAERVNEIAHALLGNFHVSESVADRMSERQAAESALLAEQELVLELLEHNPHVYLDGPAGTGKSHLITQSARRHHRAGLRTLVTCWNLLMAEELRAQVGSLQNVDVFDINALMLRMIGLEANPRGAGDDWFFDELPTRAAASLVEGTSEIAWPRYDAILIDEFQDIAGYPKIEALLEALCIGGSAAGSRLLIAADPRQQIMRRIDERVDPFQSAKRWIPALVHVKLARNCRNVQAITDGAAALLPGQSLGFTGHRMPKGVPGGLAVRGTGSGSDTDETGALSAALRELLQEFSADQVVVLSPFSDDHSLIGRFLARPERTRSERWLRKQLQSADGTGRIRWRSVFKFKGLDADAVVLTDIGEAAKRSTAENGLSFSDLLYVAVTRAKYRCIVLTGD